MSAGIDDASIGLLPKQPLLKVLLPWEGIFHVCIYFPGLFQLRRAAGLLQKDLYGAGKELYVATGHLKIGGLSAKIPGLQPLPVFGFVLVFWGMISGCHPIPVCSLTACLAPYNYFKATSSVKN